MTAEEVRETFCKPGDERALLSYAIKRADNFYSICSKVEESDFLYPEHRTIYVLLKTLVNRGGLSKFDLSMIANEAQANGVFESIGGYDYIESISDMPLEQENLPHYIEKVLESSTKYRLYKDLTNSMHVLEENARSGKSSEDLIGMVESRIMDLSTRTKSIAEPRDLSEGLLDYIDERRENPVEMSGIKTGYPILNQQIDGLVPGTLTVLSARKKMGKSTFLSNVAAHIAYKEHVPVLYVDTEMTFKEWRDRIVAMLTGVDERIVKHGGYDDETYNRIKQGLQIVKKGKLFHEHMPGYSVDKLTALYKKYKIKENIGAAFFDYIKEPDTTSVDRARREWQILGDVATRLKDLAGILDIPFFAAAQLNREGDVAGSDRISWFADVVMQWQKRKEEEVENNKVAKGDAGGQFKLIIKDSRRGGGTPEEGISYIFRKSRLLIREAPTYHQLIEYGQGTVNYGSDDEKELE
jgi:replicative DNA helicase